LLGGEGRVIASQTLEELDQAAAGLRTQRPQVVAVHGGDGTLHKIVTALGRSFGDEPLPPIAMLGGGTMNVVSASLRIRERPIPFLKQLVETTRAGVEFQTIRRRCMRIGDLFGFIFGNGLLANFLAEYYGTGSYGPVRAAWLLARAFGSALVGGAFIKRLFKRFEGTLEVDGQRLDRTSFVGVGAATVREVGMGFKLNHRADDDPDRFGFLAIHGRPAAMIPDFVSVYAGRGIAPSRAISAVASRLRIVPRDSAMTYTIDGDIYRSEGPLDIAIGPPIHFVRPAAALIVAPRRDTMAATP
jgi:diacylglycerol kinase (ATP)